jgi:hypothetical protein
MTRAFYRIRFPGCPYDFADACAESKLVQGPCTTCGYGLCQWDKPLIIEWNKDSPDVAGDFTPLLGSEGKDHILVSDRVRQAVEPHFQGLEFQPVMVAQKKGRKGTRKPYSPLLPGAGPVWWLEPTLIVPMDREEYRWEVTTQCARCGNVALKLPPYFELREEALQGAHLFRIQLEPAHIYMTEELKEFIMRQWFTNIATKHAGIIEYAATLLEERQRRRALLNQSQGPQNEQAVAIASTKALLSMPTYEELPEDNAELAKLVIEFPRLADDTPASCPVSMKDIVDYLQLESPDGDEVEEQDLVFLRTAQVGEKAYWIWQFTESDGTACYVTVSATSQGETYIGYEQNAYGLTPEQYLLGDYYNVF